MCRLVSHRVKFPVCMLGDARNQFDPVIAWQLPGHATCASHAGHAPRLNAQSTALLCVLTTGSYSASNAIWSCPNLSEIGLDHLRHGHANPSCSVCMMTANDPHCLNQLLISNISFMVQALQLRCNTSIWRCHEHVDLAKAAHDLHGSQAGFHFGMSNDGVLGLMCLRAGEGQHLPPVIPLHWDTPAVECPLADPRLQLLRASDGPFCHVSAKSCRHMTGDHRSPQWGAVPTLAGRCQSHARVHVAPLTLVCWLGFS